MEIILHRQMLSQRQAECGLSQAIVMDSTQYF